jgi:hypothetical protein
MTTLVLSADAVISSQQLLALLAPAHAGLDTVAVATSSGRLAAGDLPRGAYQAAFSVGPAGHHSLALLAAVAAALQPGAKLVARETDASPAALDSLSKNLLLSGFAGAEALPGGGGAAAHKPRWETGAKAAISLKPRAPAAAPAAKQTWTLSPDDEDEDGLVDEEDLLTADDLARPPPAAAGDDCEVGAAGRKACADCSCGRADGAVAKLTKAMLDNPTSGCGSCSLGDAFRCGGCPYRGLPAFEMGKKIEVPADFLVSDLE